MDNPLTTCSRPTRSLQADRRRTGADSANLAIGSLVEVADLSAAADRAGAVFRAAAHPLWPRERGSPPVLAGVLVDVAWHGRQSLVWLLGASDGSGVDVAAGVWSWSDQRSSMRPNRQIASAPIQAPKNSATVT
jgi:hypothetical protein